MALYTDAGVKDCVATWATVALREGEVEPLFEASGKMRDQTRCSATAELRAIANALHKLVRLGHIERGGSVQIYTDNVEAVRRITKVSRGRPGSSMAAATLVIRKIGAVHGFGVHAKWVPGHKPDNHSPHARWNNRCDALCRAARDIPRPTAARKALDIARKLEGRT